MTMSRKRVAININSTSCLKRATLATVINVNSMLVGFVHKYHINFYAVVLSLLDA